MNPGFSAGEQNRRERRRQTGRDAGHGRGAREEQKRSRRAETNREQAGAADHQVISITNGFTSKHQTKMLESNAQDEASYY